MPRSLSAVPLLLFLLAGATGCTRSPQPIVSPSAGTAPAPTGSDDPAAVDDPPGTNACHQLRAAITGATLMQPGVVDSIATASSTADAPVADAAHRMAAAYAAAVTAKGSASEPDAVAAVSATGAAMAGVCDDSGLDTVG
jgi:hypothetical protein